MRLRIIFILSILLAIYGLINLYSIHQGYSTQFYRQLTSLILGIIAFLLVQPLKMQQLLKLAPLAYIVGLITLILIPLGFGKEAFGATRWLSVGGFQFQPSEFAKIALILFFSQLFSGENKSLLRFLGSLIILAVYGILVYLQPDLGTSLVLGFIFLSMVFVSRLPLKYLLVLLLIIVLATPFGWFMLRDYQKSRILVFLDPDIDPGGLGYNLQQALIAVGSGGFQGKGFMQGTQARLGFLPVPWSDFAFATLAEEGGFLSGVMVVLAYIIILVLIASLVSDNLSYPGVLLIGGILGMLGMESLVNIGMNLGMAPVVGIPLPFISYGGTAMIKNFIALGLLFKACKVKEDKKIWFSYRN